jgi:membrane protease YdiL (CAAX protease family)
MLDNIKYFLPTYRQCWIIVFYICIIGGLGVGFSIGLGADALGYDISKLNPVFTYIAPMVPALLYILYKGNKIAAENLVAQAVPISRLKTNGMSTALLVVLTIVATIASMVITEPLTQLFPMTEAIKEVYRKMLTNTFWTTMAVAVAAPLIEEFLLRGIMLRGMLKHTSPTNAIHYSAFFFALIHMNLSQAVGAFIIGLFIGWIYYRTGSLWMAILVHFLNNGLSILFTLAFPHDIKLTLMRLVIENHSATAYIALYIIALLTFVAIVRYLHKRLKNEQEPEIISF